MEYGDRVDSRSSSDDFLLFSSGNFELNAVEIGGRITAPAGSGRNPDSSPLQQAVDAAFVGARRAGQDNPIVIGAIPFDVREPSCLYVPASYAWCDKATAAPVREAACPDLVDRHTVPDEAGFKKAVQHAIVNFPHDDVQKAVLSVVHELRFTQAMDVDRLVASLRAQNRDGHLFRVPLPDQGTLIGISPELLIRKQGGRIVSNPLAGSAKRRRDAREDAAAADRLIHSEKDQYEHRLVVESIRGVLEPLCSELSIPDQPSLLQTGALWHLSSRIEGTLKDPSLTALELACIVHPTPAVCGFPTDRARRLIRYVEPFERGFFTGLVGWCDAAGDGEWAVTIRCGVARRDTLRLFAGAGIVTASNPASEWDEVQAKLGTMLSACGLAA